MPGKALAAAAIMVASVVVFLAVWPPPAPEYGHFEISAVYGDGVARLHFLDNTGGTESVSIEIQGMPDTFFRTHHSGEFVETVPFEQPPMYGWGAHPVILYIEHSDLGSVTLKTEFRGAGEPAAPIISVRE